MSSTQGQSVAPPRNGMGLAAVILGFVGLAMSPIGAIILPVLFWAPSLLAIIFGAIGMRRAGRGEATNRGTALTGLVLGVAGLAIGALVLILVVAAFVNAP